MKILQVNVNGKYGSTGKITTDVHEELIKRGYESIVCYGANNTIREKNYYRICSEFERHLSTFIQRIHGVSFGYYAFNGTRRLIKKIKEYQPDIVHLQCINGCIVDIYKLLNFLSLNHIKTVVSLHAEFMHTGTCGHAYNCLKWTTEKGCYKCDIYKKEIHSLFDNTRFSWKKMKKTFDAFSSNDIVITAVSPWLSNRAKMSPYMKRFKHEVVMNGLNDNVFAVKQVPDYIKNRFLPDKKIILYVSASFDQADTSNKGGCYFVELAKRIPNCQFCIVASYSEDICDLPSNVVFWGRTKNQEELACLYNLADITIITSKRETFSMVTAESLCCGTPVVGFKAGGPESIAINDYTHFVEYGNICELENIVETFLNLTFDKDRISDAAHAIYSKAHMVSNFIAIYKNMI